MLRNGDSWGGGGVGLGKVSPTDHFRDDVQLTMKIFDTVISPILTYGSEVWGVDHDGKLENHPIEVVQTKFIRWLLGINKFCSSNACRSKVGRFPMRTKTK